MGAEWALLSHQTRGWENHKGTQKDLPDGAGVTPPPPRQALQEGREGSLVLQMVGEGEGESGRAGSVTSGASHLKFGSAAGRPGASTAGRACRCSGSRRCCCVRNRYRAWSTCCLCTSSPRPVGRGHQQSQQKFGSWSRTEPLHQRPRPQALCP